VHPPLPAALVDQRNCERAVGESFNSSGEARGSNPWPDRLCVFVTENSENTFPALPVRGGEDVFVRFSTFQDSAAYENYVAALSQSKLWRGEVSGGPALYLNRATHHGKRNGRLRVRSKLLTFELVIVRNSALESLRDL
jgi:hypothetical protein